MKTLFSPPQSITVNGNRYEIISYLAEGFSGQVYKISDGAREYALKIFLPIYRVQNFGYAEGKRALPELLSLQKAEYEFLSQISHPNVVTVYNSGQIALTDEDRLILENENVFGINEVPALVLEFVEGLSLAKAVLEYQLTKTQFTNILVRISLALDYLHASSEILHGDFKPANIMIRAADREPILIDFSLCKNFNFNQVEPDGITKLVGDWDLVPQLAEGHPIQRMKIEGATRKEMKEEVFPGLDIFQYGKMLQRLYSTLVNLYQENDVAYIKLITDRLLDWDHSRSLKPGQLTALVKRLDGTSLGQISSDELGGTAPTNLSILVPPGVSVPFSGRLRRLIESPSWRRLATINQLSLLPLVFPGSGYPRSTHVLYSYELGRRFTETLVSNPFFRLLFDEKTILEAMAVILLHDINHFPFMHIFQESGLEHVSNARVIDYFCDGDATGDKKSGRPSIYEIASELGIDSERLKRLILKHHHQQESEADGVIRSLIDSGVDVDKLSYLSLDAHFSGVPYGKGIDLTEIIRAATILPVQHGTTTIPHLAFDESAIEALESVVMTRFWNFRALYWEQRNRAAMAMLLRTVRRLFSENKLDLYRYLDATMWSGDIAALKFLDSTFRDAYKRSSIVNALIEDAGKRYVRLYTLRTLRADAPDASLYASMAGLTVEQEFALAREIARQLEERSRHLLGSVHEDEVLIDIPRRPLDSGGSVYVSAQRHAPLLLNEISEPVRSVIRNYDRMAKSIRVYVSPRLATLLPAGSEADVAGQEKWRAVIESAVAEVLKPGDLV
jgi:HD superfamily phosphohydrolase